MLDKVDYSTFLEDFTSSIVLKSGWAATSLVAAKYGRLCTIQGFLGKSSSIANGDVIFDIPDEMNPAAIFVGSVYAAAKSPGTTSGTARVDIATNATSGYSLEVRTPSTTLSDIVFGLVWIADS